LTIGLLEIDLMVHGSTSLKEKRRVVKSLKTQMRNRFNCSVAETGNKDSWSRAHLAVCIVGDDARFVNTQLNEIARFVESRGTAELVDYAIEML
jgi:hypothetical protein